MLHPQSIATRTDLRIPLRGATPSLNSLGGPRALLLYEGGPRGWMKSITWHLQPRGLVRPQLPSKAAAFRRQNPGLLTLRHDVDPLEERAPRLSPLWISVQSDGPFGSAVPEGERTRCLQRIPIPESEA